MPLALTTKLSALTHQWYLAAPAGGGWLLTNRYANFAGKLNDEDRRQLSAWTKTLAEAPQTSSGPGHWLATAARAGRLLASVFQRGMKEKLEEGAILVDLDTLASHAEEVASAASARIAPASIPPNLSFDIEAILDWPAERNETIAELKALPDEVRSIFAAPEMDDYSGP